MVEKPYSEAMNDCSAINDIFFRRDPLSSVFQDLKISHFYTTRLEGSEPLVPDQNPLYLSTFFSRSNTWESLDQKMEEIVASVGWRDVERFIHWIRTVPCSHARQPSSSWLSNFTAALVWVFNLGSNILRRFEVKKWMQQKVKAWDEVEVSRSYIATVH